MENWESWKTKFLYGIGTKQFNKNILNEFITFSESILKNGTICEPFSKMTNDFLENFIPSVVMRSLDTIPIDSETSKSIGTILELISKLLGHFLSDPHILFTKAASKVLINRECRFFSSTAKVNWFGYTEDRPFFKNCVNSFKSEKPLGRVVTLLESSKKVSFQFMCIVIDLFSARIDDFGSDALQSVIVSVGNRIMILNSSPILALRDIDEDYVEPLFVRVFANNKIKNVVEELKRIRIEFYINFIKSDFLKKKFVGLKNINNIIYNTPEITKEVAKSKLLENLLPDIHEQLIEEVGKLMTFLSRENLVNHIHFTILWHTITNQSQFLLEKYLRGILVLLQDPKVGKKNTEELLAVIVEVGKYNPQILKFMVALSSSVCDNTKCFVYNAFSDYLTKTETVEKEYTKTLCAFLPTDSSSRLSIQSTLLSEIKKGKNVAICLDVLSELSSTMTNNDLKDYIFAIFNAMKSSDDPSQYLSVLSNTFSRRNSPIDNRTYEVIADSVYPLLSEYQENVSAFFSELVRNNILSEEMLQQLFLVYCTLEKFENAAIEVAVLIYGKINKNRKDLFGFNGLFDIYTSTGNKELLTYIIDICSSKRSRTLTKGFVDSCFNSLSNNSLTALLELIYRRESGVVKSNFQLRENKILTRNESNSITVRGDYNGRLKMPKEATFVSLLDYFANLFGTGRSSIKMTTKGKEIDPYTMKITNNIEINVKTTDKGSRKQIEKEDLPSFYVNNEKYLSLLHSCLLEPDSDLYEISFKLLEKIPTIEEEKILYDSYEEAFPIDNKLLCIYRFSAIAEMIKQKDELLEKGYGEFIPRFVLEDFNKEENERLFIYILELFEYIVNNLKIGSDFYSQITQILDENSSDNQIVEIVLKIIADLEVEDVFDENFLSFFGKELLQTNKTINTYIIDLCQKVSPETYLQEVFEALPNSLYVENSLVSNLLESISNKVENIESFWENLVSLVENFVPSEEIDFVSQMAFQVPCKTITNAVYRSMLILLEKDKNLEHQKEVLKLLVEKVMFSNVSFYEISETLFNLVKKLIKNNKDCCGFVNDFIKEAISLKIQEKESIDFSAHPYQKKGLTNLGATCYMNSIIQQLFGIPEIRNAILTETGFEDGTWEKELQKLFCCMIFTPERYASTEGFAKVWKGYDDEPISLRTQMDAVEFLTTLLEKVSTSFRGSADLFTGKIQHRIVREEDQKVISETTELFTTVPLDIKDVSTVEESLELFKTPVHIMYQSEGNETFDALQYSVISEFPDILILHLKRFEYNLQTSQREKINTFYNFPSDLSINDNEYELGGILVHVGTAQAGHNFSFVRDYETSKWREFNDVLVAETGKKEMMNRCTGGSEVETIFDRTIMAYRKIVVQKSANAYLLVYHKKVEDIPKLQIDESLLNEEKEKIKKSIWQRIPAHPSFNSLYEALIENDSEGNLAFATLIGAITNKESHSKIVKLSDAVSKSCEENEELRNSILSLEIYKNFVVEGNNKIISKLIKKCLKLSEEDVIKEFIDSVSKLILDDSYSFMNHWRHFKRCLAPFELYPNATISEEDAVEELFFRTFDTYISINATEDVIDSVHCKGILAVISQFSEEKIVELFTKEKIIQLLSLPDQDSPYIAKIAEVLHKNEKLFSIFNGPLSISASSNARIYQLALCQTNTDNVLHSIEDSVFKSNNAAYVTEFLQSLASGAKIIKENRRKFIERSKAFIMFYLLSLKPNIREIFRNLLLSLFTDQIDAEMSEEFAFLYKSMIELLPILENQLKKADDTYSERDFTKVSPSEDFFQTLEWIVMSGDLKKDVFNSSKQIFSFVLNLKKRNSKIWPRIDALDFLATVLDKGLFETFFLQVPYKDFLAIFDDVTNETFKSIEVASNISKITPMSSTMTFLQSQHGIRLFEHGFKHSKGSEVENFLRIRTAEIKWDFVRSVLWKESVISRSFYTTEFIKVCQLILKNAKGSTVLFEKQHLHEVILKTILKIQDNPNKDKTYYTELCNCIIGFNVLYKKENRENTSFFGKPYVVLLCENILEIPINFQKFIYFAMNNSEESEPCLKLLNSFSILCETMGVYLLKEIPSTFLNSFTGKNLEHATNIVFNCLVRIRDNNVLCSYISKHCRDIIKTRQESADRFVSILTRVVETENNVKTLQSVVNICEFVLASATDPNILTGTSLFMVITIYERRIRQITFNVKIWLIHIYSLIKELLKKLPESLNDLHTVTILLNTIKTTFKYRLPKLQISPENIEIAIAQLQSIEDQTANEIISTILEIQS